MTLLPICLDCFGGHVAKLFRALRAEEHRWQLSMAWCFLLSWQRLCCKMQASNLDVQRLVGAVLKAWKLQAYPPQSQQLSRLLWAVMTSRSTGPLWKSKVPVKVQFDTFSQHTDSLIRSIRSYMVYAWRIESVNIFCCRGLAWRCCNSFYRHVTFFILQHTKYLSQQKTHKKKQSSKKSQKMQSMYGFSGTLV